MSGVRCWIAAALVIATCCTASVSARATEPCAQVVSYFMYPDQGSALKQHEWRICDPSHGGDALFLANAGGFDEVRWDTNFRTAWYRSGLTLYAVDWKRGAKSKPICTLPEIKSPVDWWFNPDSACWQYGSAAMFDSGGARLHFACELWQSSRDFRHWRRIRSDTLECESGECDEWSWTEGEWARHAPAISPRDLADCGTVLWGTEEHLMVVDDARGKMVISQPRNSNAAVWVQAPRHQRAPATSRPPPRLSGRSPSQ